jgi:hypothetical protein
MLMLQVQIADFQDFQVALTGNMCRRVLFKGLQQSFHYQEETILGTILDFSGILPLSGLDRLHILHCR